MRVLITGLGGTLAPKVAKVFEAHGATVVGWDRSQVDPENLSLAAGHLEALQPEAIVHLAMGSEHWAALMARYAAERNVPFLFTSTAMVFHHEPDGPHHPADPRSGQDGYAEYKIRCEDAIWAANPQAIIARIGWQIDPDASGNNMLAHLDQWQEREGKIGASQLWKPACSFMTDTAQGLWTLLQRGVPGTYHLDSNAADGWTFDQVVAGLKQAFGRENWTIEVGTSYQHDQRLAGNEDLMVPLSSRLKNLQPS